MSRIPRFLRNFLTSNLISCMWSWRWGDRHSVLKEDAMQEIINHRRILRGKCFFYLELEEKGQVGPSPYMDLCINLWCRKIGEAAGKSDVLKKARMHLIGIRAFCQVLVLAAGESLLVRWGRPKAWGLNLGRISPTPFHLVWSSNPLLFELDFYKSPFFPTFPNNWYIIFSCYFIVYFCDFVLKIFISRLRCRYQTQSSTHKNTLVGGHWSLVSGD